MSSKKQLHVRVSPELKEQLRRWRNERGTTYEAVVTDALTRHFELGRQERQADQRLARLEAKVDRLIELLVDPDKPAVAAETNEQPADVDATAEMEVPAQARQRSTTSSSRKSIIRRRQE